MDILAIVWGWIVALANTTWAWLVWIWNNLVLVAQYLAWVANALLQAIIWVARTLYHGVVALTRLNFRAIWNAIKRGYERVRGWYAWYLRTIQAPLDRMRRQIWDIYRRFFKPILMVIDRFRAMVRIVAIFNRRLAARLDARLFALESAIMAPLLAVLRRLNELASYNRAWFTALGYLDRILIIETLRRDALLVWEVLTNPLGRIFDRPQPQPGRSLPIIGADFRLFLDGAPGYYSDQADRLYNVFRDTLIEV